MKTFLNIVNRKRDNMYVKGFKAFNENMTNRYGMEFTPGIIYISTNIVKFKYNGFHLCKNFEDTLRYFDAFNENINICSVCGFGNIDKYSDEYYGYYDMYSVFITAYTVESWSSI